MQHDLFQVATKAIIRRDNELLVLTSPKGGYDFPGGRIHHKEYDESLLTALRREIREECGDITVDFGALAFVTRRPYVRNGQQHRILALYYEAQFVSGDIVLSNEHSAASWLTPDTLLSRPDMFSFVDELSQFRTYFGQ